MESTDIILVTMAAAFGGAYYIWSASSSKPPGPKPTIAQTNLKPLKITSFVKKAEEADSDNIAILFYGSQTGTAEDFATRFAKELQETYGVWTLVCDFEDYDTEELENWPLRKDLDERGKKWLACYFMATYGEGEPTDNANDFYEWVMNGQGKGEDEALENDHMTDSKMFEEVSFVIFGLGNKTYEYFNAIVRRLARRLIKAGATMIGEAGEGDDDASMESDFLTWKAKVLPEVAKYFNVTAIEKKHLPHVPLFNIINKGTIVTPELEKKLFYGELSDNKPRRWKLSPFTPDFELVGNELDLKFAEILPEKKAGVTKVNSRRGSNVGQTTDQKHPYYSRVSVSEPLFKENFDDFKFDNKNAILPKSMETLYNVVSNVVKVNRQCYHIELDISGTGITYQTGDHVGIWAENDPIAVEKIAKVLKIDDEKLDEIIELKQNPQNKTVAKSPFSHPCSVRNILTYYVDLRVAIKQYHFEILSKYTSNHEDKERLWEIATDRELFVSLVENSQKTLAEILESFPSIAIPLQVVLVELLHKNNLRYYSISSSSKKDPKSVAITAVIVRYALESPAFAENKQSPVVVRQGQVTSYLERITKDRQNLKRKASIEIQSEQTNLKIPKFHVPMFIRTSAFKLPKNPAVPVIMVGPGTGVAPFRGFLWDRVTDAIEKKNVGETILFFGSRDPEIDWLYRDEMTDLTKKVESWKDAPEGGDAVEGKYFKLEVITGFSRVKGQKKFYVQDRILEQKARVWDLLENQKACFYICGDAKHMATSVTDALTRIAGDVGGKGEDGGKNWMKAFRTSGRFFEDTW